ncbi:MFS transporter [Geothrix sp.]|uniref:MFS transporter n=1 Tax=Geothrix sp. TaxID=1962974 RepID=UPI003BAFE68A
MADGRPCSGLWGLAGLAATTLLFAVSKQYWLLVAARFLQGASGAATWLPGMALLADHFPSESRGRADGHSLCRGEPRRAHRPTPLRPS